MASKPPSLPPKLPPKPKNPQDQNQNTQNQSIQSIQPPLPPKAKLRSPSSEALPSFPKTRSPSTEEPPLPPKPRSFSTEEPPLPPKSKTRSPSTEEPPLPPKSKPRSPSTEEPPLPPKPHSFSSEDESTRKQIFPFILQNVEIFKFEKGDFVVVKESTEFRINSSKGTTELVAQIGKNHQYLLTETTPIFSPYFGQYLFKIDKTFYKVVLPKETTQDTVDFLDGTFETYCKKGFYGVERLKRKEQIEKGLDLYNVIEDHEAKDSSELSLHVGDTVSVLEKNPNGRWYGKSKGNKGYFPSHIVQAADMKALKTASNAANKIEQGGQSVGRAIIKGSEKLSEKIKQKTEEKKAKTEKQEGSVSSKEMDNLDTTNKVVSGVATGTKKVAVGISKGAAFLGSTTTKYYKQSDYYKKKELEESKKDPSVGTEGAKQVGEASINAVVSVVTGIKEGARTTYNTTKESSVDYQRHKYGDDVAEAHAKKWEIGGGVASTVYNVKQVNVITVSMSAGVGALSQGEEVKFLYGGDFVEGFGSYQDWAVEQWHDTFFRLRSLCLAFYKDKLDETPFMIAPLDDIREVVYPIQVKNVHSKMQYYMGLRLEDYTIRFAFEKEEEVQDWVNSIQCLKKVFSRRLG